MPELREGVRLGAVWLSDQNGGSAWRVKGEVDVHDTVHGGVKHIMVTMEAGGGHPWARVAMWDGTVLVVNLAQCEGVQLANPEVS